MQYHDQQEIKRQMRLVNVGIGVEAELAREALSAVNPVLAASLRCFYGSPESSTLDEQATELGVSSEVHNARLQEAHVMFTLRLIDARRAWWGGAEPPSRVPNPRQSDPLGPSSSE